MQEFLDDADMQVKKIAKFDLENEKELNRLSVYDFNFHLQALLSEQDT